MKGLEWRVFPTHRVAFYKDWMIVQSEKPENYYLYLPNDDFTDEDIISDSTDIFWLYDPEWEAGNLQEAIEFIDDYEEDTDE